MKSFIEKNADKVKELKTEEEVFAFFEENGYTFTAEEKEAIRKFAEENKDRELSDEELSQAAGGWAWLDSILGSNYGSAFGLVAGLVLTGNPFGWFTIGCMVVFGGLMAYATGRED